jgi:hypothetical protein
MQAQIDLAVRAEKHRIRRHCRRIDATQTNVDRVVSRALEHKF